MTEPLKIIRVLGLVNGPTTSFDGQYVLEYDAGRDSREPGTHNLMTCHLRTTPNPRQATQYTTEQAHQLWTQTDPRNPTRPDGKPNRPFTAFTIALEPAPINPYDPDTPEWHMYQTGEDDWPADPPQYPRYF
jgi:hypothetical protein